jgi:hypothetical protein
MWKDLVDYPSYQISNDGLVMNKKSGRILKQFPDKDGYYRIGLYNNKKLKTEIIHRLLAKAFIPNPDNLPVIDHVDRNPQNNNLSNLRWASYSTNNCNSSNTDMTTTNERNIFKTIYNTFYVNIVRNKKKICKTFKTLEEAIALRSSII